MTKLTKKATKAMEAMRKAVAEAKAAEAIAAKAEARKAEAKAAEAIATFTFF